MEKKIYNLVIIGAGPAGIATAVESYISGVREILLIEKESDHNATIRKYYKELKRVDKDWKGQKVVLDGNIYFVDGTKESTLDFFDQVLAHHSVALKTHTEVQKIVRHKQFFEVQIAGGVVRSRFVVVTIGRMGKPNKPSYKIPSTLKKRIHYTLDNCGKDEKILVVGGGDSAIEYAVDLAVNNRVTICYRRESFHRANPTNQSDIADAIANGAVRPYLNEDIVSIVDREGKIEVHFEEGEAECFDRVIYAIGGTTPSTFLQGSGIEIEEGKPVHDAHYMTNVPGLYVAGDITQESGGSIALGLNHGYAIAAHIMQQLTDCSTCKPLPVTSL